MSYTVAALEDGVYSVTTQTRYNAEGNPLSSTQKQLISQLSATLENKTLSLSERGLTSTQWSVYDTGTKRIRYKFVPTSTITAESVTVDGFARSQKDTAGIMTTATRAYTAGGMVLTQTDGRGNTTTTLTDIAGRTTSVTDAAGNVTTTAYDIAHDLPALITDAQGNTTCYRYDARGRKVAEWGTAIQSPRGFGGGLDKPRSGFAPEGRAGNGVPASQPACFGYDDGDNMTALTTFRAGSETISSDPSERTDGDVTTWLYDPATGLELSKTYADNSSVVKSYDVFNRLATETDARGNVKTHAYEHARGLHLGTTYSVVDGTAATTARSYAYNHLGQLTQVVDDAGTRTIAYNTYGEQESDSLNTGTHTHLITEQRDSYGRSIGYTYARSGTQQHRVTTGYGADGRIATAGFLHGNSEKQFAYGYLSGSNLLQTLAMPNNMTLTQSYESQRDLLTGMAYHRGGTALVAQRTYTYDTLGRPLTRSTTRSGQPTRNDSFSHNERSELSAATLGSDSYSYAYDNIGNRTTATEGGDITAYASNNLNQYTAIQTGEEAAFTPTFDADGNQTLVKTSTGIWAVQYNAENRPVSFTNSASNTVVECTYDSMGRRATKKVTTNGSVTLHQRYIYHGYLPIAAINAISGTFQWFLVWDPTQSIATRPLAIRKDGTWYAYGWDLTKNICEVFGQHGYLRTTYTYSPYGEVTESGDISQPIQWSSEFNDTEQGMIYYNYRHYNPMDGRWIGRDKYEYQQLYTYTENVPIKRWDRLGLDWWTDISDSASWLWTESKKITMDAYEAACKLNKEYKIITRLYGVTIAASGYAEAAAGVGLLFVPEPTMGTKVAGTALSIHGVDTISTGMEIILRGELQSTLTNQAIKNIAEESGFDKTTAANIATGAELAMTVTLARTPIPSKASSVKYLPSDEMSQITASNKNMVQVTRWGGSLEDGAWVMMGKPRVSNYILSGKVQPSIFGNKYAKPWQYKTYVVPKENLKSPGIIKGLLGQRRYYSNKK